MNPIGFVDSSGKGASTVRDCEPKWVLKETMLRPFGRECLPKLILVGKIFGLFGKGYEPKWCCLQCSAWMAGRRSLSELLPCQRMIKILL